MSNYFDNQDNWHWDISDGKATVFTDHGDHTHTLDVTNVPIGDMVDNTGQVMGDAHRAASHDPKDESQLTEDMNSTTGLSDESVENSVSESGLHDDVSAVSNTESADVGVESDESIDSDDGIDDDDGLDL